MNDKYENFVTVHIEAAAECIPTKHIAKCSVPRASIVIREKRDNLLKKSSLLDKRKLTNANTQKHKKAQRELTNTYQKVTLEYIQS